MIGYIYFHLFLILLLSGMVISVNDLFKRNYETVGPILFLLALIGLGCYYYEFVRVFSGLYGITWSG